MGFRGGMGGEGGWSVIDSRLRINVQEKMTTIGHVLGP